MSRDRAHEAELHRIAEVYRDRKETLAGRYDLLLPAVYMTVQEMERALLAWARHRGIAPLGDKTLLDVGCGGGAGLLEFLRVGFRADRLAGCELLPDRASEARSRLPLAASVHEGDACELDLPEASFDVVHQSTVFTSLLDLSLRRRLAERMWQWVRPGGGVLWYDFTVDNPWNRNVQGIPLREIRALFPRGRVTWTRRLTLLPPLARLATRVHPELYTVLNTLLPVLRTHVMCWIEKAPEADA